MSSTYIEFLKVALTFTIAAVVLSTAGYWARARWWRNPIGIGLQGERFALLGTLSLVVLSVFFQFNRFDSFAVAWAQTLMIFIIGLFNVFLFYIFEHIHQRSIRDEAVPRHTWRGRLHSIWAKIFLAGSDD